MKSTSVITPKTEPVPALDTLLTLRDWRCWMAARLDSQSVPGSELPDPVKMPAGDLVREGALAPDGDLAFGQSSPDALGEASLVLCWLTGIPPDKLDAQLDTTLEHPDRERIVNLVETRLATRQPMAYLLGEAWFDNLKFKVDARALIPRSLILEALNQSLWDSLSEIAPEYAAAIRIVSPDPSKSPRILDLCTGGGSIAIKLALMLTHAQIVASDISAAALSLARENLALHDLQARVSCQQSALFESLDGLFDLIVCNPPYVNDDAMAHLPPEFRAEPQSALAGGPDGMDLVRDIFAQAPAYMTPDAMLLLEIGHEADFFEAAFPWLNFSYVPVTAGERMLVIVSREDLLLMTELQAG